MNVGYATTYLVASFCASKSTLYKGENMFQTIKNSMKVGMAIVLGATLTGCISFSPPEQSANYPTQFASVPMAKAAPMGVKIDASDYFDDQHDADDALIGSNAVAIAKFTVHFAVEDNDTATTGDGGSAEISVALGGVSKAQLQAITDAAYADFVAQLQAAGRTIVSAEKVRNTVGYKGINFDGANGEVWEDSLHSGGIGGMLSSYGASGLPSWHVNPFGVGNTSILPWISNELKATVVTVDMRINFVEITSSGRGSALFSSDANVSAKPMLSLYGSRYEAIFSDSPPGAAGGLFILDRDEPIVVSGDFGAIKKGASSTRKIGANRSSKSGYTMVANPKKFKAMSLKAIQASNAAFVGFANDNKP